MARKRGNTASSSSSSIADDCSSSSISEEASGASSSSASSSSASSSSSSSSSTSKNSSSSVSRDNIRSCSHRRSHRKSPLSSSRRRTNRELQRKNNCKEHVNNERAKKRRKPCSDRSSDEKYKKETIKKASKKRRLQMELKNTNEASLIKEKKREDSHEAQVDFKANERNNNLLEVAMNAQEQQKALIRHNAEVAKARLESGELQRARDKQRKMHQLYGTVDWRVNRKLRNEKKMLERTVAAGKSLASLEEKEYARMDAFRVALGLPTAEAQRQAEWRREQTQAFVKSENGSTPPAQPSHKKSKKAKQSLIGPKLPR